MTSPTKQVSLSINGGGVLETIYNYKRGTEKTILKRTLTMPSPITQNKKHLRRLSVAMVG
jgi:hypothetical protein